jgi:hypothetical protein
VRSLAASLAVVVVVAVPSAAAKDFGPGDLRVCNTKRCVPIERRDVLPTLGAFYYQSATAPTLVSAPPLGSPSYELRFRNGYATGIVAGKRLDRFLSYGVNLDRFAQGKWYRVPAAMAAEVRRLAKPLAPIRLTRDSLARSH